MLLKPTSLTVYARSIDKLCTEQEIRPFDFPKIGLEAIEDMTETYIINHVNMLAPRYLNVTYNAIKARAVSKRITIKHKCSLTMKVMNFQSIRSILKTLGFACTRDGVRVNKAYMAKGHIMILEPVRRNNCG